MADMLKTRIRLAKVHQRLCKPVFTDATERKYFNLNDKYKQLSKWNGIIWADLYRLGFKPNECTDKPEFLPLFQQLDANSKEIGSISRKIDNLCAKYGKTEEEIERQHMVFNRGRLASSF